MKKLCGALPLWSKFCVGKCPHYPLVLLPMVFCNYVFFRCSFYGSYVTRYCRSCVIVYYIMFLVSSNLNCITSSIICVKCVQSLASNMGIAIHAFLTLGNATTYLALPETKNYVSLVNILNSNLYTILSTCLFSLSAVIVV